MNFEDINSINKSIDSSQKEIQKYLEQNNNFDKVVLIGITGAGKSTVSCLLAGVDVMIRKVGRSKVVLESSGIKGGRKSITQMPNLKIDTENNLIICDCPGFKDTKGNYQEIINSFAINCLLENSFNDYNRINILLVISAGEFDAQRGKLISENLKRVEEMFPDKKELEKGIGIIITKTDEETNVLDFIDELSEDADKIVKYWCNFFQNHPERIFSLPKASIKNVNQVYEYQDRDDLLYFVKNNQIENPIHNIALSEGANDYLSKARLIRNQQLNEIIRKIFLSINSLYSKETNMSSLDQWSNILDNFLKLEIHDTKELKNAIHQYLPTNIIFEEYEKNLAEFESFDSFINKVFKKSKSKIQKIFKENTITSITQLASIKQHVQLTESKQEQIANQQKLMEKQDQITNDLKKQLLDQKRAAFNYKIEMQKRINDQNSELKEMKDKINLFEKYDFIAKSMTNKIRSNLKWQQVWNCPHLNEKELKGIVCYFIDELNEIINVSSNSILNSSCMPSNVINYTDCNYYASLDKKDSYICFDFLDSKIQIQSYLIRSCSDNYLKNWILEGSNDNINWDYIDLIENDDGLKASGVRCVYLVYWNKDKYYRYIRLKQNGLNWNDNYKMEISFMEFYGRIQHPKV